MKIAQEELREELVRETHRRTHKRTCKEEFLKKDAHRRMAAIVTY